MDGCHEIALEAIGANMASELLKIVTPKKGPNVDPFLVQKMVQKTCPNLDPFFGPEFRRRSTPIYRVERPLSTR